MTKDSNSKMRICDSMSDRKMKKRIRTHGAHIFVMKQKITHITHRHTRERHSATTTTKKKKK